MPHLGCKSLYVFIYKGVQECVCLCGKVFIKERIKMAAEANGC